MPTIRIPSLKKISGFLLCAVPLLFVAACGLQNGIVYQPQQYPYPRPALPSRIRELDFKTDQGAQQAYYLAPRSGKLGSLWVLFSGNAGTALAWVSFADHYPDGNTGFLLIDYPGYGSCDGKPSAKAILDSSEQAYAALASSLGIDPAQLWSRTSLLGHSLGAAAAMQFAARHAPQQVVLVAPFTNLKAMGKRFTGPVIGSLVVNEYDNAARIQELEGRPVRIHIVHGDGDEIIPVSFGRELAKTKPGIDYQEVAGAHHNDVLEIGRTTIYRAMGMGGLAGATPSRSDKLALDMQSSQAQH